MTDDSRGVDRDYELVGLAFGVVRARVEQRVAGRAQSGTAARVHAKAAETARVQVGIIELPRYIGRDLFDALVQNLARSRASLAPCCPAAVKVIGCHLPGAGS